MPDKKYTDDPQVSALSGGEKFPIEQGGLDNYATPADVKTFVLDSYPGQSSITTLGTIITGTWNAHFEPRVITFVSPSTAAISPYDTDQAIILLSGACTITLVPPMSSPVVSGQLLVIRTLDDGTPHAQTFDPAYFRFGNIQAATTTVANQTQYTVWRYNFEDDIWDCIVNTDSSNGTPALTTDRIAVGIAGVLDSYSNFTFDGNTFSILGNSNMVLTGTNSSPRLLINGSGGTGVGIIASSGSNSAILATGDNNILALSYTVALGSSVRDITLNSSSTSSANSSGAGMATKWEARNAGGILTDLGRESVIMTDATNGAEFSVFSWQTKTNGAALNEVMRLGDKLEVFGDLKYKNSFSTSSTPSIAAGSATGTSPTVSIVGTNECGVITITTGTLPATSGIICTVTLSGSFAYPNKCIAVICGEDDNGSNSITSIKTTGTTTTFVLAMNTGSILTPATTYTFNYIAKGY